MKLGFHWQRKSWRHWDGFWIGLWIGMAVGLPIGVASGNWFQSTNPIRQTLLLAIQLACMAMAVLPGFIGGFARGIRRCRLDSRRRSRLRRAGP